MSWEEDWRRCVVRCVLRRTQDEPRTKDICLGLELGQDVLASYLIYARALLEYVIFSMWVRSVTKMLPSMKFAEDKLLTFLILREKS